MKKKIPTKNYYKGWKELQKEEDHYLLWIILVFSILTFIAVIR